MTLVGSCESEILATSGWLSETPPAFREAVLGRCLIKRFERGASIYRTGDPPGGLYGLVRGGVGIELSPNDREPYMGTFARPGFWIGEGSVLTRGPRYIGIRAARDSVLAYLPIAQWDAIVQGNLEAWRWLAHLALRNELLALAVADALMVPGAATRTAAILLILSSESGPADQDLPVTIDVSQDTLARMSNLSRSSTGRILQAFEDAGLVAVTYRQIRIVDRDGLRNCRMSGKDAPPV